MYQAVVSVILYLSAPGLSFFLFPSRRHRFFLPSRGGVSTGCARPRFFSHSAIFSAIFLANYPTRFPRSEISSIPSLRVALSTLPGPTSILAPLPSSSCSAARQSRRRFFSFLAGPLPRTATSRNTHEIFRRPQPLPRAAPLPTLPQTFTDRPVVSLIPGCILYKEHRPRA